MLESAQLCWLPSSLNNVQCWPKKYQKQGEARQLRKEGLSRHQETAAVSTGMWTSISVGHIFGNLLFKISHIISRNILKVNIFGTLHCCLHLCSNTSQILSHVWSANRRWLAKRSYTFSKPYHKDWRLKFKPPSIGWEYLLSLVLSNLSSGSFGDSLNVRKIYCDSFANFIARKVC